VKAEAAKFLIRPAKLVIKEEVTVIVNAGYSIQYVARGELIE
jgi:hypothetical protein